MVIFPIRQTAKRGSYVNQITAIKKPYYHWLERAQLGQLDYAVLRLPKAFHEQYISSIEAQISQHPNFVENDLFLLPKARTYESFDTRNQSLITDLLRGKNYSFNRNSYSELTQSLSIHLQNETKLTLDQIGHYDLGAPLPRELNPVIIEKQFSYQNAKENERLKNFMKFLERYEPNQNEYLLGFVLLEMLDNLFVLRQKFHQFKVYLALEIGGLEYGIEISELHIYPAKVGEYFIKPISENEQPYLGGCLLKIDNQSEHSVDQLFLHPSYIDLKNKVFSAVPLKKSGRSEDLAFNYFGPEHEKIGQDYIYKNHASIRTLQSFLTEQNISYAFTQNPISIKPSRYGLNLQHYLEPGHESIFYTVWTEFVFQNETYRMHNYQVTTPILLQVVANGLGFLSDADRKEMASSRKGLKRDNDLRILKHQGVACLIITEACRHILNRPLTTGQFDLSDEQFLVILESNIFDLFKKSILVDKFGEINPFDKSLSSFLSEKVYSFFKQSLKDVLGLIRSKNRYAVIHEQIVELQDFEYFTAESLLIALEPLMFESKGDIFTKASSKFLEEIIEATKDADLAEPIYKNQDLAKELAGQHIKKIKISDDTTTAFYGKLSDLALENWDIHINTKPLEKLSEEDFKSEITIQSAGMHSPNSGFFNKVDWFELSPKLFFKGVEINLEDVNFSNKGESRATGKPSGIIFYKGRPYLIDPNSVPKLAALEKFWDRIKSEQTNKTQNKEKEFIRLPKAHVLELLALIESGTTILSDHPYWQKIYSFYKSLGSEESKIKLPTDLTDVLKPHQQTGTQWIYDLYQLNLGGILADDMGLGKTLQVLTFLNQHRLENNNTWSLVVVPTSLSFNWESEAKKFTPDLDVELFNSAKKEDLLKTVNSKNKVIITTYGLLTEHEDFFTQIPWDTVVFDEAQNLKNLSSKRTSSARLLKAKFKLALSGTPLENNFMDFFSLTDLVLPGSMGSYRNFQEMFGTGKTIDPLDVQHIKRKMKPIVLRRTKESVNLNLPRKSEESLRFDFSEKQIEIYKNLAIAHNDQVTQLINEKGQTSSQLAMLTALLRLRQACSDPSGIPHVKYTENTPKVSHIIECVKEHIDEGKSVLIFTQFLATLDKLSHHFTKENVPFFTMHGSISGKARREILDKFQNSEQPQVLLMTLKTGGVGLNLTKASVVYHIEPWWNPAVENQATDRSHRLGQKNEVQVYRLLMKDSVEEKIELLKLKKKAYFDSLFSDSESLEKISASSGQLSVEDFKFLIGI